MADQTVTLRITANTQGLVTGVELAKRETRDLGDAGERAGRQASAGMAAARNAVQSINQPLALAKQAAIGFASAFASIQGIRALAGMADTWSDLTSRVRLSIGAHESGSDVMRRLHSVAQQTYSSFELTAETFARNATTLNALGVSTQRQLDYTQALNNALVVSGAKAERAEQVQNSLAKAMAEGTLRGEDFNNVMNYGSRVAEVLAEELGVNVTALRGMAADGKITADVILNSLVKNMDVLTEQAESMPTTIGDAFTLIRNSLMALVGQTDEAAGSTGWLAEQLVTVSKAIDIIAPEVQALASLWSVQADEQAGVATSAEDIAYGMKTVVTGLILAKNAVDVVIAGFRLLVGVAVAAAAEMIDSFDDVAKIPGIMRRALNPLTAKQALEEYAALVAGGVDRTKRFAEEVKVQVALFSKSWETNVDDVSRAFEFLEGGLRNTAAATDEANESAKNALFTGAQTKEQIDALADAQADLYTHLTKVTDATDDVDAMLRNLAYGLADEATRALMDYEDVQARILELEMAWLDLGPMSEAQIAKLAELRRLAAEGHARNMADLNDGTVREAQRAAQESARAWEDFTGSLADAVLDGSDGVKRWWKQMIDDMKRQLIQSGLLRLFGSLFGAGGGAGGGFSLAGGGGIGFGQLLGSMFGGGGTGSGALGSLFNSGSWMQAGGSLGAGFAQAVPWLAAAGGALSGYNRSGIGAAVGYGALGWVGGTAAYGAALGYGAAGIGGAVSGATGAAAGAFGAGSFIPVVGWIAAIAAAIDMISGGKVFGTKYRPESSTSTISVGEEGYSANGTLTQVRNRSLFRGRKWETHAIDPGDEARAAAEAFYAGIYDAMTGAARSLAIDVPPMIDAAIRTVTEYDKKGRVTGLKIFTDALGRTWEEAISDPNNEEEVRAATQRAASRITSEAIIAVIDAALGTTVQRAIGGTGPGLGGGGGPGLGGGRRGDDFEQAGSTLIGALDVTMATMGEASAIAERWRDDVELLAEGAQFLLLAASDIRAGAGLLGEGGTLTQIADLIEELQASGETLSDAYIRVATSAALLDQALALSGVSIEGTREHIVRLATSITDAAGGLEQAQALWQSYFANFYSAAEMAQYTAQQQRTAAGAAFAGAGLDLSNYLDAGGMERFRAEFEAALPTMSAEDIAAWLRAADALAAVTASARAIDAALADNAWGLYLDGLDDSARAIAELTRSYDDMRDSLIASAATADQLATLEDQRALAMGRLLAAQDEQAAQEEAQRLADLADLLDGIAFDDALAGMSALDAELARLARQFDDAIAQAIALGASEDQLALIRAAGAAAAARAEAAEAERLAQALAQGAAAYTDFVTALLRETQTLSTYQTAMRDADGWRAQAIATANEHARAAGMAGASEQALALIELRASQLRAQALAQLREETQSLVDQLYGGGGTGIGDAFSTGVADAGSAAADYWAAQRRAAETLQNYLDSMLLGDLSALTPEQQLAEAWEQLNAAVTAGDADQATRLADVYLRMLRGMEASGDDYNQGFWSVRELLEGMLADIGEPPESEPGGGGGGYITADGAEQIAARNRLELAAQLAQHLADLAGAVGQTVWELMDSMGVDLRQLTADLGISLQDITAETVLALVNMAGLLGTNLLDLTSELGLQLTDLGGGIRELAENTGINLDALTVQSTQALGALANQLGIDLADIAASVGVDLGSLADAQSLLNQALAGEINRLPAEQGDALRPYLAAIENATSEADANAAIDALSGHVNTLAPDIRNALAPYFADVFPVDALTDLDYLTQIATDGAAQLAAAQAANALLARIADNAMAANNAAGIPSYAVGTYNVPQTGPAILHAGEMVLPVPLARVLRDGMPAQGQAAADNREVVAELRRLGEKVDQLERSGRGNTQELVTAIDSTGERSDRELDLALGRHNIGPRGRTP